MLRLKIYSSGVFWGCPKRWVWAAILGKQNPDTGIFLVECQLIYFEDAPVQTLLGHRLVAEARRSQTRPIIFAAFFFPQYAYAATGAMMRLPEG